MKDWQRASDFRRNSPRSTLSPNIKRRMERHHGKDRLRSALKAEDARMRHGPYRIEGERRLMSPPAGEVSAKPAAAGLAARREKPAHRGRH